MELTRNIFGIRDLRPDKAVKPPPIESRIVFAGDPHWTRFFQSSMSPIRAIERSEFFNQRARHILPCRKSFADAGKRISVPTEACSNHDGRPGLWPLPQVLVKLSQERKVGEIHGVMPNQSASERNVKQNFRFDRTRNTWAA
jgi:hypothetical protein